MFIRVDLPDPDEPMIATYSPRSTVSDTPRSACTVGLALAVDLGHVADVEDRMLSG